MQMIRKVNGTKGQRYKKHATSNLWKVIKVEVGRRSPAVIAIATSGAAAPEAQASYRALFLLNKDELCGCDANQRSFFTVKICNKKPQDNNNWVSFGIPSICLLGFKDIL